MGTETVGTIGTDPMPSLRQALAVRGLVATDADWVPLDGGRSNLCWRTRGPEGPRVVKLYRQDANNPLFPNDPRAEAQALLWLAGRGVAPRHRGLVQSGVFTALVYDHVPGGAWRKGTAGVARLLGALHRLAPPPGLRHLRGGSDALVAQTHRILSLCPPSPARDLVAGSRPDGPFVPEPQSMAFLHGDPVPGNLIHGPGGPVLIDWQCPATGDAAEDIALFLSPAMQLLYRGTALEPREVGEFLSAYPDPAITERYRMLAPWYHWRMAAYCLWRGAGPDEAAMRAELSALAA